MKKYDYYQQVFSLFLKKKVPVLILYNYINSSKDDAYSELADFVGVNLKKEMEWSTSIAIIEAVDNIYNEALFNGNIVADFK
jgi:hypothetical protein